MSAVKAKDAAAILGVTARTLYNYRDEGCPHLVKPLRFDVGTVREWMVETGKRPADDFPPAVVRAEVADLASDVRVDFDQLRTVLREREFTETEVRRIAHALKLAKASKEQIEVDKRKVELAKRMGELIPRAEAIDERAAAFAIVRTRVMQISARCAADVVALGGQIAEVEERIRAECVWALEDLSRGE